MTQPWEEEQLRTALLRFGDHRRPCAAVVGEFDRGQTVAKACSCGWEEAKALADRRKAADHPVCPRCGAIPAMEWTRDEPRLVCIMCGEWSRAVAR